MSDHKAKAPFCCVNCGKPARKKTETIYNPFLVRLKDEPLPDGTTKETWDYRGNKIVVSRRFISPNSWDSKKEKYLCKVSVWDGETWELSEGIFCTASCGLDFGIKAYRAGYRVNHKVHA